MLGEGLGNGLVVQGGLGLEKEQEDPIENLPAAQFPYFIPSHDFS